MKRYYPILVALIVAGGIGFYVLSGKSSGADITTVPTSGGNSSTGATNTTSTTQSATAAKLSDGTHTGKSVMTDYGDVQVALVVSGGKITAVNVLKQPGSDARSQQINASAIPQLQSEVLAAQSANINSISGASFTSDGFMQSLNSAFSS